MKQFFKIVFASMFGTLLSMILLVFIFFIVIAGIVASSMSEKEVEIKSNSVLYINFKEPIVERSNDNPFENFDLFNFESDRNMGLNNVLMSIEKAAEDPNIQGIYLDVSDVQMGLSTLEEVRNAFIKFKKANKFIYAYSEVYSQKAYYLASVSDSIFLNPYGLLMFNGFNAQYMFFKGSLEKLEIEPQVLRVGSFKSAVEPYMMDHMSDSNKVQTSGYLNALFNHMIANVAESKNMNYDSLLSIAVNLKVRNASDALSYKMVDKLAYKDEMLISLQKRTNAESIDKINMVDFVNYTKQSKGAVSTESDKIAVIYANGEINSGEGSEQNIGSEGLSKAIRKARLDSKVKAVVLRINSPGGSALASDVIWREVVLCKAAKPVVVSMGDVAASGGYYIACAADSIIAQPTTITGSIGVFGIIFNAQNFFKNKLGITFDQVKTGNYADLGDMTRPLTVTEREIIQAEINRIYETFTQKVADGRKMQQEDVKKIAEGRVWSGIDAKRIGLVDKLGSMNDAIEMAAKMAKIDKYRIVSSPEIQDPFEKIMKNLSTEASLLFMPDEYKALIPYTDAIEKMRNNKGIQMRLLMNPSIE